jgi:hypothetical protein
LEVDFIWFLGAKMFPEPQRCIAFTMMLSDLVGDI